MESNKVKFADAQKLALSFPDAEPGTAYGSPAIKVKGKLLACIAIHKSAEPDSLAVRVSFEDRNALLASDAPTYYLTDHYVEYPVVLARLSRLNRESLKELLQMGYRFVTARNQPGMSRRKVHKRIS